MPPPVKHPDRHADKRARAFAGVQAIARERGGRCLSTEYVDFYTHLRWRCAEGHEWDARPRSIRGGAWCGICAAAGSQTGTKARAFAKVQAIARERGGRCLSTEYVGSRAPLRWRCAEGHEWHTVPAVIRQGSWCPTCSGAVRSEQAQVFARVQAIARERGGLCLSTEYVNANSHLRFRCAEGHEWDTTPSRICIGRWCPRCGGTARKTIEEMRELARTRGGRCLSRRYSTRDRLRWRCGEGHEWEARPDGIRRGTWCPYCAGKARKTIADVQAMAAERGGACLSTTIKSTKERLRWRCGEGHEWEARSISIQRGSWCPYCAGKARRTIADVQAMAAEHGGACLSTTIKDVHQRLRFRCRVGHAFETTATQVQRGQWCPGCRKAPRGTLERLRGAAARRGGVLLDTEYQGSHTPVRLRCGEGHEWSVAPCSLLSGRWCPECAIAARWGRPSGRRLSIAQMQEAAESRGGRCLSDTYVNNRTPLRWQCHDGHEWDAVPASIRAGHWCPICATRHCGTIDGMRALAAERGGTCRSRVYQNHHEVLRFTCARGHAFTATGMAVKSGVWCPTCAELEAAAAERPRRRGRTRTQR